MFNKILVALDHSASYERIFEEGLTLAKMMQARLCLVHVITPLEETYPISTHIPSLLENPVNSRFEIAKAYIKELEAFERKGLEMLRSHANIATEQGLQAEVQQPSGYPARILCDVARTWNAKVIVIGRRSRNILSKVLLGSVSNYVTHHAPCSVLIVQNNGGPESAGIEQGLRVEKQLAEH